MYIYGEREKVNYGMNLHKCSRTLNESKDDSQEETLSKSQSTTLSATSCCLIILGLSFASVLKSSQ